MRTANIDGFIIANTCFYYLYIPDYKNKEILKIKLEESIVNSAGLLDTV